MVMENIKLFTHDDKKLLKEIRDSLFHFFSLHKQSLLCDTVHNFIKYNEYSKNGFGELQILCDKYGSDKGSILISGHKHAYNWPAHTYASIYEIIFAKIKDNVTYIFECGIGTNNTSVPSNMTSSGRPGASLRVWREYFKKSIHTVYGADIDKTILFRDTNIITDYMDQTSKQSIDMYFAQYIQNTNIKFNIMIDDGLHTPEAAICLFKNSIKYLTNDGIYIIEDVHSDSLIPLQEFFATQDYMVNYIIMNTVQDKFNNCILITKEPLQL